ncbi:hypothetical protein [Streptomyces sp. NBC_00670]|uniref:hypothetical protein n=1 Tax=Streptomyces sp. NBC_00670 TaxID=2975804 RepID=UPI002E323072|nr:hypothetical protein [Streptomyces sp. NBC_00670]
MPRGRHRHSPPLHRLLPPSVIAGVSVVCAVGPWLFTEAALLRGLAAGAAVTTVVGTFVMRRWDVAAGKRVADLTRARASDEWRHEERVAELETDIEESRELRQKLEQKLRGKRTELARLRNEHAALLRRYATAETERASALEGRRLLEIEAAPEAEESAPEDTAASDVATTAATTAEAGATTAATAAGSDADASAPAASEAPRAFSPAGAKLFRQAGSALERLVREGAADKADGADEEADASEPASVTEDASDPVEHAAAGAEASEAAAEGDDLPEPAAEAAAHGQEPEGKQDGEGGSPDDRGPQDDPPTRAPRQRSAEDAAAAADAPAQDTAAHGPTDSAAAPAPEHAAPASLGRPAGPGHFTVPTAVAVVPTEAPRRPSVQGGFDFFGTQKTAPERTADSVHNEDLADVVGQEALALHKAEAESGFKPAGPEVRAGQVIDLTEHDETEQIDIEGLRTAAS